MMMGDEQGRRNSWPRTMRFVKLFLRKGYLNRGLNDKLNLSGQEEEILSEIVGSMCLLGRKYIVASSGDMN
jgi:hypothetical protein